MTDLPKSQGAGKQTAPSVFFRQTGEKVSRAGGWSGSFWEATIILFKEPRTAQYGTYVPCLCCKNYWLQFIHNFSKMFLVTRSAGVSEWQTRETQNLLLETTCGFESRRRHPWQGQYGPLSCEYSHGWAVFPLDEKPALGRENLQHVDDARFFVEKIHGKNIRS